MRLLLDTHIFLWSLLEPDRLSKRVATELERSSNELWLSPMTTWEVMILAWKRRIILDAGPMVWIRDVLRKIPFREAPVNHEVAMQSHIVNLPHQDPVDRFLAATSMVFDLTLITADERLLNCEGLVTLANK
jgi:PIN domain nuclease of toxin-antitoxin system